MEDSSRPDAKRELLHVQIAQLRVCGTSVELSLSRNTVLPNIKAKWPLWSWLENWSLTKVLASFQDYGFTADESLHALNTHKSVRNALQFLTSFNHQPGEVLTFGSDKVPALSVNTSSAALSAILSSASSLNPHGDSALQDKPSRQTSPQQKWVTYSKRGENPTLRRLKFCLSTGNFIPSGWGICFFQ